jgi:DNA-binding response OmpR family regulator
MRPSTSPSQPSRSASAIRSTRIRAVLRRVGGTPADGATPKIETHGELSIDRSALTTTYQGLPITVAPSEMRLLLTFSASPGQVFSRQKLLEAVWEHGYHGDP